MFFDAIPFSRNLSKFDIRDVALGAFTDYLEKKLRVKVICDLQDFPHGRPDLQKPFQLGNLLKEQGIIKEFQAMLHLPDEPKLKGWTAICNDASSHMTGGTTWDSDEQALYAALAEALERYIWWTQNDYFINPTTATVSQIAKYGSYVAPEKIAGFSEEQRALDYRRKLRLDAEYLWIQGESLVTGGKVYVPAQVVTGMRSNQWPQLKNEPMIRQQITTGLATWHTQAGARLSGALEVLEREAYMIMWINQLTLPRVALEPLCAQSPSLAKAVKTCAKYRIKTHVVQLLTDAPTHAIAVVLEDIGGNLPRFSVGIRTDRSLPTAIEKAMTEALRSYRSYRIWAHAGNTWDMATPVEKIGHRDRLYYWSIPEHAKHLEFMLQGKEIVVEPKEWEQDSTEEYLGRIVRWCKEKKFDCISFSLGTSAKNPTPFHIEMVVIPQLQPTYLNESVQQFGGTRWKDVPAMFGYTPRQKPFADRPHPFS